jgi:hypothetical protein
MSTSERCGYWPTRVLLDNRNWLVSDQKPIAKVSNCVSQIPRVRLLRKDSPRSLEYCRTTSFDSPGEMLFFCEKIPNFR